MLCVIGIVKKETHSFHLEEEVIFFNQYFIKEKTYNVQPRRGSFRKAPGVRMATMYSFCFLKEMSDK